MDSFPVDRINEIKEHPEDFRLLERIPITRNDVIQKLPIRFEAPQPNETLVPVVFLDTETTGFDRITDDIIELALVRCTVSLTRNTIVSVDACYGEFQDPGRPLSQKIIEITGITDDLVRGHRIDANKVSNLLCDGPLVIAHNAGFDRPFFEKFFPNLADLPWACTQKEINWDALGFGGKKLEFISQASGYFYDAHRALNDCLALAFILHINQKACEMLLNSARQENYRIFANGAPYDVRNGLKSSGFSWNADQKVWWADAPTYDKAMELVGALHRIYDRDKNKAQYCRLTAYDRYKAK